MDNNLLTKIRIGLSHSQLPFTIRGAMVFGSQATGSEAPGSDIDLLIIAEGIHPKLQRRGEQISLIKRILSPLRVDVLLLTRKEVTSNFENHNPLFLDIAEEGLIVLDSENFLENLVGTTRAYIRLRGIRRTKSGWLYPVNGREPTLLSKVSNRDFSLAMLTDAERDFIIGKGLSSEGFFDKAVYHFQQCAEKSIKSVLITIGVFEKTHFVGEILRECVNNGTIPKKWKKDMLEIADISSGIEPDVSLSRYPGIIDDALWLPFDEYEREDAVSAMEKTEKTLTVARKFVREWFSKESDSQPE